MQLPLDDGSIERNAVIMDNTVKPEMHREKLRETTKEARKTTKYHSNGSGKHRSSEDSSNEDNMCRPWTQESKKEKWPEK